MVRVNDQPLAGDPIEVSHRDKINFENCVVLVYETDPNAQVASLSLSPIHPALACHAACHAHARSLVRTQSSNRNRLSMATPSIRMVRRLARPALLQIVPEKRSSELS